MHTYANGYMQLRTGGAPQSSVNVRGHQTARSEVQTPARAEIWNEISASCTPRAMPLGPQHRVPEPVPGLETHHQQVKGRSNVCRYVGRKEETRMK